MGNKLDTGHHVHLASKRVGKTAKENIVKIQLPFASNDPDIMNDYLMYNEDRSIMFQGKCKNKLRARMDGSMKKYFYYHMRADKVVLEDEAPWQDW